MRLIKNWPKAWRMFSVQALALIAFLQGVIAVLPESQMDATVPFTESVSWRDALVLLSVVAAVIGGIGRLIEQPSLKPPDQEQP